MLNFDAEHAVLVGEGGAELGEEGGEAGVEFEVGSEGAEFGVGGAVEGEVVEQGLQVGEFTVVAFGVDEFAAFFPELRGIDAEAREENLVLHVVRAERLIVVVNQSDGGLSGSHVGRYYAAKRLKRQQMSKCGSEVGVLKGVAS